MTVNTVKVITCALLLATFGLAGCMNSSIKITDAKISAGIDEKLMPTEVKDVFPSGTKTVFCWFQWKGAQVDKKITASWHFITDDIHILNYDFAIPRKEGWGSVSLSMPEGKALPVGLYKVDLSNTHKLKSLTFKVE